MIKLFYKIKNLLIQKFRYKKYTLTQLGTDMLMYYIKLIDSNFNCDRIEDFDIYADQVREQLKIKLNYDIPLEDAILLIIDELYKFYRPMIINEQLMNEIEADMHE